MTKNIAKFIISAGFALALVLGSNAYAQEEGAVLKQEAQELRETHKELKAQVSAGEITKEEARAEWKELIESFRDKKESFFNDRIEKIQEKYKEVLETNPERAEMIKERIDLAKERHSNAAEKRDELRAQVTAGEITKEEAREQRVDFVKAQKADAKDLRDRFQEKRQELRDNRKAASGAAATE
jgi:polyhydroxyalkanoate synthesis regulator phasin